jgi:thiamine-monophosphate kinase
MNAPLRTTVSELGELELLARILGRIGSPTEGDRWSGDDTAVLRWPHDRLLVTTDMMVQGIDFELTYATGADIGWKAVSINASDIAAMGACPTHAVAAVGLPPETELAFVDDLMDGIIEAASRYGVALVGGDLSAAREISIAIAMLGTAGEPILRTGARAGDAICVTGFLGGAAAGLVALRQGMPVAPPVDALMRRQLRPEARVEAGAVLAAIGPTAMIDLSDGLAVDLGHLLDPGDLGCEIEPGAIPIQPGIDAVDGLDPLETAVLGGEDFELLFTLDPAKVDQAASELSSQGVNMSQIGEVTAGEARLGERSLEEWRRKGWEHLRTP